MTPCPSWRCRDGASGLPQRDGPVRHQGPGELVNSTLDDTPEVRAAPAGRLEELASSCVTCVRDPAPALDRWRPARGLASVDATVLAMP